MDIIGTVTPDRLARVSAVLWEKILGAVVEKTRYWQHEQLRIDFASGGVSMQIIKDGRPVEGQVFGYDIAPCPPASESSGE